MIRGIRIRNIRWEAEMIRGTWDRKFESRAFTSPEQTTTTTRTEPESSKYRGKEGAPAVTSTVIFFMQ